MVRKKVDPMHKAFVATCVTQCNALLRAMSTNPQTRRGLDIAIAQACGNMHAGKGIEVFKVSNGWVKIALPHITD
jgi:hypothetical protein